MLKPAVVPHAFVQRVLTGMPERRVPEVVGQGDGLGQIFVERKRPGDGTADLGYLDRVRQARAEQVALVVDENLGFVFQPAKRRAVNDAVAVALIFRAVAGRGLRVLPSARAGILRREWWQHYAPSRRLARGASRSARG